MRGAWRRVWRTLGHADAEQDVDREIQAHLELRTEELIEAGWSREAARAEAERLFGDRGAIADEAARVTERHDRSIQRTMMWDALRQDVAYALRALARSPGFAAAAVATLALGIGANAAIFTAVNGILLKPLPFDEPEDLVYLSERTNRGGTMAVAWPNFLDWQDQVESMDGLVAFGSNTTTVLGGSQPLTLPIATVSGDFWSVFRIAPVAGRLTNVEDHHADAEPVVAISERLWRQELGGEEIGGGILEISGVRARVVGVVPDGFDFPNGAEIWAPAEPYGNTSRTSHNWQVVGRLAPGMTREVAEQEVDRITRAVVQLEADADPDFLATGASVVPLRDRLVGSSRALLFLLFGAAGMVLLVACANLASTLLARGTVRRREFAIRASLGAGRARVVRQLLTEGLTLASLGAAVGLLVAFFLTGTLKRMGGASLPRIDDIGVDLTVVGFAAAAAVVSTLLFALFPAVRQTKEGPGAALRSGARGSSAEHRGPVWLLLVGTEVALAVVLLTGSALLVRSFQHLIEEDLGVDASDVATAPVALSLLEYESGEDHARFYTQLIEALEAHPGVRSAGVISSLPASGRLPNYRLELDGDLSKTSIGGYVVASSGAFEALDIPLLAGRHFDRRDGPDDAHVAIVSETFAAQNWPGESAIGRSVTGGGMDSFWQDDVFAEVVGVVGDVRIRNVAETAYPTVYFPYTQRPSRLQFAAQVVAEAEAEDDVTTLPGILRAEIGRAEPDVPLRVVMQRDVIRDSLAERRFLMVLLSGFSVLGWLLAGIGIFGVVSYSVARRTREMGIRVALGANPSSVGAMVMRSSIQLVAGGVVVGVLGALLSSRLLSGMLYEIEPGDPVTITAVALLLLGTAVVASWVPARAGTRTDPIVTMRAD